MANEIIKKLKENIKPYHIILTILIVGGLFGNYNKVAKVDEALIEEIVKWVPIIEEIMINDVEFSQELFSEFEREIDSAVYVNDLSKREVEYMGIMKVYTYSVYRIKYYQNQNDTDEEDKAKEDYLRNRMELKRILKEYRSKYDFVDKLWEASIFTD